MNAKSMCRRAGVVLAPLAIAAVAPATAFGASDLGIVKADSADPVTEGGQLTYTLTVTNAGPDTANGVEVVDELPNQVDLVGTSATQGTCDTQGKRVTCALGALDSGATASVSIVVRTTRDGDLSNTATVSTTDPDPNTLNDSDTEATRVVAPPAAPACGGKTATVVGTGGDDQLVGTAGRDVIAGLGGNDTITGLGGNDIVCGAGGQDSIRGQGGRDTIRGGAGNDNLRGGRDADVLRGGGGDDVLRGGGGNDLLRGGGGRDSLGGGGGDDGCRGGGGRDTTSSC